MGVGWTSRLSVAVTLLVVLSSFSPAQTRSSYDPARPGQPSKPKQGFVDFALGRINPSDKDYGKCIGESRKLLFEETIEDGYFWSNVIALGLLGCLFLIVIYQRTIQVKREWTTAEALGQYAHALARANIQVGEATKENHALMETLAALRESALRSPSLPAEPAERVASSAAKLRTTSAQPAPPAPPALPAPLRANPAKPTNGRAAGTATATEPVDQMRLFTPDADLIMKLNSLEQQLAHSQEDNKQLRRRITDGDRRLETEQQKNRQLKGA